jgi:hypothetical protein
LLLTVMLPEVAAKACIAGSPKPSPRRCRAPSVWLMVCPVPNWVSRRMVALVGVDPLQQHPQSRVEVRGPLARLSRPAAKAGVTCETMGRRRTAAERNARLRPLGPLVIVLHAQNQERFQMQNSNGSDPPITPLRGQ